MFAARAGERPPPAGSSREVVLSIQHVDLPGHATARQLGGLQNHVVELRAGRARTVVQPCLRSEEAPEVALQEVYFFATTIVLIVAVTSSTTSTTTM